MNSLSKFFVLMLALPFFLSCANNENKKEASASPSQKECYIAIDGSDTAYLDLNIVNELEIDGNLLIKYKGKEQNKGTISGKFSGDTLFVDYTFNLGETTQPFYKNPLALLKKDKQLILGVGVIETTLGKSYFAKDKPINFERGKFVFEPVNCKN